MTTGITTFKSFLRSSIVTPLHRLLNAVDTPVIVLLYHRVTTLTSDPEQLAVTPENFRSQMKFLKDNVPLARFDDDWAKMAKPAVIITFDDGYADNVREALPILEEYRIPATFFISTGTIDTTGHFWWHELEQILFDTVQRPSRFTLQHDGRTTVRPSDTGEKRREVYRQLVPLMMEKDAESRNDCLSQLRRWANTGEIIAHCHRAMSLAELHTLAENELVTIGAHTVTHSQLTVLPPNNQREEIVTSKHQLETWLGREITTFSYPFGKRCHYTHESITACREAGFTKAAANFPGQIHRWTDPYQIPRHLVRNWSITHFERKLQGFWTR